MSQDDGGRSSTGLVGGTVPGSSSTTRSPSGASDVTSAPLRGTGHAIAVDGAQIKTEVILINNY